MLRGLERTLDSLVRVSRRVELNLFLDAVGPRRAPPTHANGALGAPRCALPESLTGTRSQRLRLVHLLATHLPLPR